MGEPIYPETHDPRDADAGSDGRSTTGMPRWVKVSGIIVLLLVLLFVVLNLTGIGPDHGPSRHTEGVGHTLSDTGS